MFYIRIVSETDEGIFHLHKCRKLQLQDDFYHYDIGLYIFDLNIPMCAISAEESPHWSGFFLAFCDNIYMDDISKVNSPLALPLNAVFSSVRPICLASAPEVFIHMLSLLPFKTLGHGARKCRRATPGMTWGRCFVVLSEGTPYLIDN